MSSGVLAVLANPKRFSSLADFSTLKIGAIGSSETSLYTRPTRRYISEDDISTHSQIAKSSTSRLVDSQHQETRNFLARDEIMTTHLLGRVAG
jgi:hypothetical protein